MASPSAKVLIVTGGGSGIGQAIAVEFARKGYNVVITGRTQSKLDSTVNMCKAEGLSDKKICSLVADVTKPGDNTRTVEKALEAFGRIDVLVNNVGLDKELSFEATTLEDLDDHYKYNVRGPFDLTQKAMPHLLKNKGNMIFITVFPGHFPKWLPSPMMKECVDHLARCISVDYAPKGVRVNTIGPGVVRTAAWDTIEGGIKAMEDFAKYQPIPKAMEPRDVALLAVFLASDDASFITGANVPIDGAWRNTMALPK